MAKNITLADLNTALKPIIEALNKLREDQTSNSSQVLEMHSMVTNLSVKMDTLEQTTGATLGEVSKPAVKKSAGRKPAVRKVPTKRGTKAKVEQATESADQEEIVNQTDGVEQADQDDPTEQTEHDDPSDEADQTEQTEHDYPADEAEESDSGTKSKKAAVKKTAAKKATVKKATVKKAAPKKTAAPRLNKMTIFKDEYKNNPSQFDQFLTAKVKKEILSENDKWSEMSGDALANAQRTAYYHYMKDNHDDVLESLKSARAD